MIYPENKIIVLDMAGDKASVFTNDSILKKNLLKIGFYSKGKIFEKNISNDEERQSLAIVLANMRAIFSSGRDWSPAELMDFYKEKGILKIDYETISWKNPNEYQITTR